MDRFAGAEEPAVVQAEDDAGQDQDEQRADRRIRCRMSCTGGQRVSLGLRNSSSGLGFLEQLRHGRGPLSGVTERDSGDGCRRRAMCSRGWVGHGASRDRRPRARRDRDPARACRQFRCGHAPADLGACSGVWLSTPGTGLSVTSAVPVLKKSMPGGQGRLGTAAGDRGDGFTPSWPSCRDTALSRRDDAVLEQPVDVVAATVDRHDQYVALAGRLQRLVGTVSGGLVDRVDDVDVRVLRQAVLHRGLAAGDRALVGSLQTIV